MAPNNEVSMCTGFGQVFNNFFENLEQAMKFDGEFKYPSNFEIEENGDRVNVNFVPGDFKENELKISISENGKFLLVEATKEEEMNFYHQILLPFPCLVNKVETENNKNGKISVKVFQDKEQFEIEKKKAEEEHKKMEEALEKFRKMAEMKPISLENVQEENEIYQIKINPGDYKNCEMNAYFNGPYGLILEAKMPEEVKRSFIRHVYLEQPCDLEQELNINLKDGFYYINVKKDIKAIKASEEFAKEIKPLEDFFNSAQDHEIITDDDKFQVKTNIENFKNEEIKVRIENDEYLVIEANHDPEEGPHFKFYKKLALPEHSVPKNLEKSIQDGNLKVTIPICKPAILNQG